MVAAYYDHNMRESVTFWPKAANDGFGGLTYGDPRVILARWQDSVEVVTDAQGRQVASSATVYLAEDIEEEGLILRGESYDDPPADVQEIIAVARSPSLDQQYTLIKAYLK